MNMRVWRVCLAIAVVVVVFVGDVWIKNIGVVVVFVVVVVIGDSAWKMLL